MQHRWCTLDVYAPSGHELQLHPCPAWVGRQLQPLPERDAEEGAWLTPWLQPTPKPGVSACRHSAVKHNKWHPIVPVSESFIVVQRSHCPQFLGIALSGRYSEPAAGPHPYLSPPMPTAACLLIPGGEHIQPHHPQQHKLEVWVVVQQDGDHSQVRHSSANTTAQGLCNAPKSQLFCAL